MSQDNFLKTLQLLQSSYTTSNNNELQEIQKQLSILSENTEEHINNLLRGLSIDSFNNFEINCDLHKSIAICLKNVITSKIEKPNQFDILSVLNSLLNVMLNSNQKDLLNQAINQTLNNVISLIISNDVFLKNEKNLEELLNLLLNEMNKNDNIIMKSNMIISLLNTLISGKCFPSDNLNTFIHNYLFPISDIIFYNTKLFINSESINFEYFEILKGICEIFYSVIFKLKFISNKNNICNEFLIKYNSILHELFTFRLPNEELSPNQIIYFSEDKKLKDINFMKAKALQVYTTIIQISTNADEDIKSNDFIKTCSNITSIIIKSLEDLLSDENKLNILQKNIDSNDNPANNPLENIIYQIFAFLTRALIREPIKTEFIPYLPNFLLNIVFPLITSNKNDIENMKNEGENYYNNTSDMFCEFQRKSYKTASCFLIKKLYEKIVDIRNFILSYVLQMLLYILSDNKNINEIQIKFYLEYKDKVLIDKFNDEIKVDFCFLILLIFKDNLPQLSEKIFQNLIYQYQNKLHNSNSGLIKCKMCNIYQYYYDLLSKNNTIDFNQNVFNFLMNSLLQSKENEGLGFCASNALVAKFNTIEDEEEENIKSIPFLSDVLNLNDNFNQINSLINDVNILPFFDFIKEIISNIEISNRQLIINCLENIINRFKYEFSKVNSDFGNLYISVAFKILRSFLSGVNKIRQDEVEKFCKMIESIVNFIKNPLKNDFVDDIIILINDLNNSCDMILPISNIVFQNLELICTNNSSINDSVYDFISTYFKLINNTNGININEVNQEILKIVNLKIDFQLTEIRNYFNLIILRIISTNIFNSDKSILENLLIKVYDLYDEKLKDQNEEEEDEDDEIIFSNLVCIGTIYVSFIYFPDLTFDIFLNKDLILKILDLITEVLSIKKDAYSISLVKCIILGICSILTNQHCIEELEKKNRLFSLINDLFLVIIKQKKSEINENKNLMKKELNCNFVEEEENSDFDDFIDYNELEEEREIVDETINNNENIKNSDVYQYFTNILTFLKNNNPNIIDNFYNSLNINDKNNLENLMHTRQVKIKYKNEEYSVPRRTLHIIRNNSSQ